MILNLITNTKLTSFSSIIVAQRSKRVAITEATVLQQIIFAINVIEFQGNIWAFCSWLNEFKTSLMNLNIGLPVSHVSITGMIQEERSFQGSVVTKSRENENLI